MGSSCVCCLDPPPLECSSWLHHSWILTLLEPAGSNALLRRLACQLAVIRSCGHSVTRLLHRLGAASHGGAAEPVPHRRRSENHVVADIRSRRASIVGRPLIGVKTKKHASRPDKRSELCLSPSRVGAGRRCVKRTANGKHAFRGSVGLMRTDDGATGCP